MSFKSKFEEFQTVNVNDSLILRKADPDKDCNAWCKMYRDEETFRYYGGIDGGDHRTPDGMKVILRNQNRDFEKVRMYAWVIADVKTDKALGRIHFSSFENNNKVANIGYWLGRESWGKGIMSACINSAVKFGFSYLELERIYTTVHIDNVGSWKALEKNGFLREGLLRHSFYLSKKLHDCYMYSRLHTD